MARTEDTSTLFTGASPAAAGVSGASWGRTSGEIDFRQGTVLSFNNSTGENTIEVGSTVVENLPVVGSVEAAQLISGDVVGLLYVRNRYFILGRIGVTGGFVQFRGGSAIAYDNGPEPPTPTAPIVTPGFNSLDVEWDGAFVDGVEITPDWSRVEIHVSDVSGVSPNSATLRDTIESREGGDTTLAFVPDSPEQYVRLVSRSLAGVYSQPSIEVPATPGTVAEFVGDVGAGTTIFSAPLASPPTATATGDWWYTTDTAQAFRWDGATWVEETLPGVAEALQDAFLAQQTADSKVQVFRQTTAPTATAVGDLWVDTDNDNQLSRWDGATWVPFQLGTSALQPGSIVASTVLATGTITGSLIDAQAITADKMAVDSITAANGAIANLAVVDANIADLNVGKLTAGTMGADVVVAGEFTTAQTGDRVTLSSTGIFSYDSAGNLVLEIPQTTVPFMRITNPTGGSSIEQIPATDTIMGETVETRYTPNTVVGADMSPGRIWAFIDNVSSPGDDRPGMVINAPQDHNRESPSDLQLGPIVSLYSRGAVRDWSELRLSGERINISGYVDAGAYLAASEVVESTILSSISNTTYAAGTPVCGLTFTAPGSGKVAITVTGDVRIRADPGTIWLGWELRTGSTIGSGTIVTAVSDDRALRLRSETAESHMASSFRKLITGLTPGDSYNVRTLHKVASTTDGQINYRMLMRESTVG